MIYDCFPFYNELEVLDIRLNELNDVVDKFVLVESTRTFQKEPKPLYFQDNKQRYSKFLHKIEHIIVDDFPGFFYKWRIPRPWDYSNYQKDQVKRALMNCNPDDTIIISDVDEIPAASKVEQFKDIRDIHVFEQMLSNFFLNYIAVTCPEEDHLVTRDNICFWKGAVMVKFSDFSTFRKTRKLRGLKDGVNIIKNGGWHFSFIGDFDKIRKKLDSWEHSKEDSYNHDYLRDKKHVEELISLGSDLFGRDFRFNKIELDEKFPEYLMGNKEKFTQLLFE